MVRLSKKIVLVIILAVIGSVIFGFPSLVKAELPFPNPQTTPDLSGTVPPSTTNSDSTGEQSTTPGAPDTSKFKPLSQAINPKIGGQDTRYQWIFQIWNWSLGMVNIIVAGLLIFLAFVNIIHIKYDTYALKKSLPTLIVGVILANLSLLICRMVVDFSDVLSKTFIENKVTLATDLQKAMGLFPDPNSALAGAGVVSFAILAVVGLSLASGFTLIALLVAFILAVLPSLGILILAFLLYIRVGVVYVLVAVSPLAFIMMALPSTQSYFKQWWGQFSKWVFMAPIVFFLLKIASMVKSDKPSLFAFVIALTMLYLAIQVPFKMGGAVMALWGGLGKRLGKRVLGGFGRAADQAMIRSFGHSPTSMWNAMINRAQKIRTEDLQRATGRSEKTLGRFMGGIKLEQIGFSDTEMKLRGGYANEAGGLSSANPGELRKMLTESNDYGAARKSYLGLLGQAEATPIDKERFFEIARKNRQMDDALIVDSLTSELTQKGEGGHYMVPALTTEGGKIRRKTDKEYKADYLKSLQKLPGRDSTEQRGNLERLVKTELMPGGVLLNRSEFASQEQGAVADMIASHGKDHDLIKNSSILVNAAMKYEAKPKVDIDTKTLSGADEMARAHVMAAMENPEALDVPVISDVNLAYQARSVAQNWDKLKETLQGKLGEIGGKLPQELQNMVASKTGGVIKLNRELAVQLHTKLKGMTNVNKAEQEKNIEALFHTGNIYSSLERAYNRYDKNIQNSRKNIDNLIKKHKR